MLQRLVMSVSGTGIPNATAPSGAPTLSDGSLFTCGGSLHCCDLHFILFKILFRLLLFFIISQLLLFLFFHLLFRCYSLQLFTLGCSS